MAKTPKIIPVSDLRQKTSDVLKEISSGEPVFITQRGRAAAVIVSMKAYERSQHELDVLRLLAQGEKEIEAGSGYELDDVLKEADRFLESAGS
ncbi:MAG: type II toxin-antitoxin system Phd/YefM family antitoxin [Chloroflexi bacterium]|nr:type II toxin-antitoxin system Phd/YefM family antitoxin [Chloroflexota bacterium]